jgi:hypothetical protein
MPAPQKPSHTFRLGPGIVLTILAMIVVPAAITLNRVRDAGSIRITSADPTPQGYTWSLLLFVVPIIVIAGWLFPQERIKLPKSAFWRTISTLVPLGFALDFFFAHKFFVFPNHHATLGIGAPALGGPVPIEEYLFYFSGFIAILLIYIWLDEFWLAAYNVPDYVEEAKKNTRLLVFHPTSAVLGVLLVAATVIYKKMFSPEPVGFPGYLTVLIAGGLIPSVGFYPTVKASINWRAFSLVLLYILLVSLVWEATLALPYGWWGYQPQQMLGVSVKAWSSLPLEAVCVWIAVTYGTTITFEVVKLWLASQKPAREAFFGAKKIGTKAEAASAG